MPSTFSISKRQVNQIIDQAKTGKPREVCGLMGGRRDKVEKLFPATNVDTSDITYMVDPKEQFSIMKEIRENEMELVGIYHSHPDTEAYPSPTDCRLAFYEQVHYVIVSLKDAVPSIRAFKIINNKVIESKLEVLND